MADDGGNVRVHNVTSRITRRSGTTEFREIPNSLESSVPAEATAGGVVAQFSYIMHERTQSERGLDNVIPRPKYIDRNDPFGGPASHKADMEIPNNYVIST